MEYKAALALFFLLNTLAVVDKFVRVVDAHADGFTTLLANARLYFLLCMSGQLVFWTHVVYARYKVHQRFRIPGDICEDCSTVCCCGSCCAIAQLAYHIKSSTPGTTGGFSAPDVLPAYTDEEFEASES